MTEATLEPLVAAHPFLHGMDTGYHALIASFSKQMSVAAGQMIFDEGDEARWFYLLQSGRVALEVAVPTRSALVIQTLEAGEVLGWSWLFSPYHWAFSARALEPSRALVVDGARLREQCDRDLRLGYEIMKRTANVVIQRLQATRLQLLDVYGNVDKR